MDEDYMESKCIMLDHNYDKDGMCPACTFFKTCRKKNHTIFESDGVHVCAQDFLKDMTAFDTGEGKDGATITINRIIEDYGTMKLELEDGTLVDYVMTEKTLQEHELATFEFDTSTQKLGIEIRALNKYKPRRKD